MFVIQPHQDGPAYFPVVAILSLGSPVDMDFTPHSRLRTCTDTWKNEVDEQNFGGEAKETKTEQMDNPETSVLLMPQSLLVFKDNAYSGGFLCFSFFLMQRELGWFIFPASLHLHASDSIYHKYVKKLTSLCSGFQTTCMA